MNSQIVINNLLINYYRFKADGKKTVLFLHGWCSDSLAWSQIVKNLAGEDVAIYAIDLPGFGKSTLPKEAYSVGNYTEVVVEFIKKLELKNIILVGHSFGGRVSIKLAATNPELIDKVVLVDSAGLKLEQAKSSLMNIGAKIIKPIFKPSFMQGLRRKVYEKIGSGDYLATPQLTAIYVKVTNEDLRPYLSQINKSTLILWGEEDKDTPLEYANIMNKEIKDSKKVVFANAGHFSFIDQPKKFTEELVKFINIPMSS